MLPSHMMLSCLLGAALLAPVPLGTGDATAGDATAGNPGAGATADAGRTVDYRGLRLTVPAGWRVVHLDRNPEACLRLDLPTLYLGPAGTQGECGAARAAAPRADTLHLEPLEGAPPRADIPTVGGDEGDPLPKVRGDSNELRYTLRRAGLMATVSYGTTPEAVRAVLTRARSLEPAAAPGPVPVVPVGVIGGPRATAQEPFTGEGFDACTAPSQRTMDAWRADSPFGAVGVYIGGRARACAQPQLTAGWVNRQAAAGWHLMPIWVGPQPWSSSATGLSTDPSEANEQGRAEAEGAAHAAAALGLAEGTVLYNDLENYTDRATWDAPVVAYLTAWTVRLHELGYGAAAYVSASSGAKALSAHYAQAPDSMPDVLWVARWNGSASVTDADLGLPAGTGQWAGARRAHQFRGDHDATYGDVTLNIDRSWLEVGDQAPKAAGQTPGKTPKAPGKGPKAPGKTAKAPSKSPAKASSKSPARSPAPAKAPAVTPKASARA
ncbi:glycoside hydrolase domain-containing protein [Streptomyces sp. NPDC054956]